MTLVSECRGFELRDDLVKPWMSDHDIAYIEDILIKRFEFNKHKPIKVFEWGSGGSTYYFAKFLTSLDAKFEWVSVEYNKRWFEDVSRAVSWCDSVKIYPYLVKNDWLKQRRTKMDTYIKSASKLGCDYDLILVDGRKRRRCVLEASKLLGYRGRVVLHDAHREYYHCSTVLNKFNNSKFYIQKDTEDNYICDIWVAWNE